MTPSAGLAFRGGCRAGQAGQADHDCVATGTSRRRQPWLLDGHRGCRWRKRLLADGHVGAEGTTSRHSSDRLRLHPWPSPDKRSVPRVLDPPEPAWTKRGHGKLWSPLTNPPLGQEHAQKKFPSSGTAWRASSAPQRTTASGTHAALGPRTAPRRVCAR
ncbi:hypothetical protein COCMIDRAFT_22995 [Bipolaris oryzae ATCC 44560]|uniref:Uncharacterized protein n=1 Tax=Bipolaris oryzae ATCC 44560 TaxID=930090 RepID=W7A075_COCMI|nr:uncharacterized protein COCMIDRAFT_22995 [Bipolaris oryzae ATCC 44560]EUC49416.1 hypothetical protein COCMIDRAFT_22995 [Bipolaris oryzae ATCC 44560]